MTIAYFDCFSGISGDMILGALIDVGLPLDTLRNALRGVPIEGYELQVERTERHHITGTKMRVRVSDDHSHRHLSDILRLMEGSSISESAKEKVTRIFHRLAEAEAQVHGTSIESVHFHEVGATDAIVDVVGAVVGLEHLRVDAVYASALRLGTGWAQSRHGRIPIPAPATLRLLEGVPVERTDIRAELVTPTGAAILTTLAKGFGPSPLFRAQAIGYGAGNRDLQEAPNLLRVQIGETEQTLEQDHSVLIETNIDDMTPEVYGYIVDQLLSEGAKDVYLTPVFMKKGRPGILLSVLVDDASVERIARAIFRQTTSLGVRISRVDRLKVKRRADVVQTAFGPIRVKVAEFEERPRITPEFDDCARIAAAQKVPILDVYRAAEQGSGRLLSLCSPAEEQGSGRAGEKDLRGTQEPKIAE